MNNAIFQLKDNKPRVTPEALVVIPEFKKIWQNDKTRQKWTAQANLAFIYQMCNPKAIYTNYPDAEKEKVIIEDLRNSFNVDETWMPSADTYEGLKKYKNLIETPTVRMLNAAKNTADKLANYFENVDFTLLKDDGNPVYDAKKVVDTLRQLGGVVATISELRDKVKLESEQDDEIVRGGMSFGLYGE